MVGMWGLVFILLTVKTLTVAAYPIVILFGFLSGCGVASFSVGIPQVSYWFPQSRQGTALGAYGGIGISRRAFSPAAALCDSELGIGRSYFAWFTFLLIGVAIYAWFARDAYFFQLREQDFDRRTADGSPARKARSFSERTGLAGAFSAAEEPRTWGLVALYFVSFGGFLALTAWFPTYWISLHHMDVKSAAALGGLGFSLLAAVVRVFGGMISERIGGERTAVIAFIAVLVAR